MVKKTTPNLEDSVQNLEELEKQMHEKSEMGEVLENLDSDSLDTDTKMSTVDFNTRLSDPEISACLVIDELTRLHIFPDETGITRQKKRLSVSLQGQGRQEKVAILSADRDFKANKSIGEKIGGLFQKQG